MSTWRSNSATRIPERNSAAATARWQILRNSIRSTAISAYFPDGTVRTFFLATDGIRYFERQAAAMTARPEDLFGGSFVSVVPRSTSCRRGGEGLVRRWRDFVAQVEKGYPLGLDDYRNDLDVRTLIAVTGLDTEVYFRRRTPPAGSWLMPPGAGPFGTVISQALFGCVAIPATPTASCWTT